MSRLQVVGGQSQPQPHPVSMRESDRILQNLPVGEEVVITTTNTTTHTISRQPAHTKQQQQEHEVTMSKKNDSVHLTIIQVFGGICVLVLILLAVL